MVCGNDIETARRVSQPRLLACLFDYRNSSISSRVRSVTKAILSTSLYSGFSAYRRNTENRSISVISSTGFFNTLIIVRLQRRPCHLLQRFYGGAAIGFPLSTINPSSRRSRFRSTCRPYRRTTAYPARPAAGRTVRYPQPGRRPHSSTRLSCRSYSMPPRRPA